ncbi:hypothetical protein HY989_06625 [Candidatus Micrarchaeota archaeon]|nr:hypothetical protein [Candidatus Micrarchaeota archaeon]
MPREKPVGRPYMSIARDRRAEIESQKLVAFQKAVKILEMDARKIDPVRVERKSPTEIVFHMKFNRYSDANGKIRKVPATMGDLKSARDSLANYLEYPKERLPRIMKSQYNKKTKKEFENAQMLQRLGLKLSEGLRNQDGKLALPLTYSPGIRISYEPGKIWLRYLDSNLKKNTVNVKQERGLRQAIRNISKIGFAKVLEDSKKKTR